MKRHYTINYLIYLLYDIKCIAAMSLEMYEQIYKSRIKEKYTTKLLYKKSIKTIIYIIKKLCTQLYN